MTVRRKRISSWMVALLLALATPALAAEITEVPTIRQVEGNRALGVFSLLEATAGDWSPAGAEAAYAWLRCDGGVCTPIDNACSRRYLTTEADVNKTLQIRLTVDDGNGPVVARESEPTGAVTDVVYDLPEPSELPSGSCTKVTPTGPKEGEFVSGTQPEPQPEPILRPGGELTRFIKPFPVVRVAGSFTRRSTTITRVSVRAPRGVRIGVQCRGRGCTYRRRALSARVRQVRSLERSYRPGAVLQIRVTQPDRIGKFVRLRVRSGRAPLRIDRCLMPEKTRPVKCPAV